MVETTKDRRAIKTKKAIKFALAMLIEEKGFNEISITDLTNKADINRGTFYLHYQDKFDLLEQYENELLNEFQTQIKKVTTINLKGITLSSEPLEFMVHTFYYFKENAQFLKALLGPKGDPHFQLKLKAVLETGLFNSFIGVIFKEEEMTVPKEYFITYTLSAHIGLIKEWLDSGMKESPEEMAKILMRLFLLGPFKTIGFKIP